MKLIDLKPRWIDLFNWSHPSIFHVGVSFLCPQCDVNLPEHGEKRRQRLAVQFWPPIDPDKLLGTLFELPELPTYHRRIQGDSFETLTLEPSIGFESFGHWHGRIINGVIK